MIYLRFITVLLVSCGVIGFIDLRDASDSLNFRTNDELDIDLEPNIRNSFTNDRLETAKEDKPSEGEFKLFWNLQSANCHNFNVNLNPEQYGFTVNQDEAFIGEKIVLMYSPGLFPRIFKNNTASNGGIPQLGNLEIHMQKLMTDIEMDIPNEDFDGIGVIDMESWEPNFESAKIEYKQMSIELARQQHPDYSDDMVREVAAEDFEWWARLFLEQSLQAAQKARPHAAWGYYQYPLCKNVRTVDNVCKSNVLDLNNHTLWLFGESTALFPSFYMFLNGTTPDARRATVAARIDEALRFSGSTPVYPYTNFQYHDDLSFLPKEDLVSMLGQPKSRGLPGVVMWSSTHNCDTAEHCQLVQDYLQTTLGPYVQELTGMSSQ